MIIIIIKKLDKTCKEQYFSSWSYSVEQDMVSVSGSRGLFLYLKASSTGCRLGKCEELGISRICQLFGQQIFPQKSNLTMSVSKINPEYQTKWIQAIKRGLISLYWVANSTNFCLK